ncbi:hypothetical protein HZS_1837 [Henneguya salminicola]|nr:hypothetical protein HZS_1837 [Henneguya salminicola]
MARFGLIIKKKATITKNVSTAVGNIFGADDPEPESLKLFDPREVDTNIGSSISLKLSKAELDKALQEDASVCQYDELYDEMEEKKRLADPRRAEPTREVDPLI